MKEKKIVRVNLGEKFKVGNRIVTIKIKEKDRDVNNADLYDVDLSSDKYNSMITERQGDLLYAKLMHLFEVKPKGSEVINSVPNIDDKKSTEETQLYDIDLSSDEYINMSASQKQEVLNAKFMKLFEVNRKENPSSKITKDVVNTNRDEISVYSEEYKKLSDEEKLEVVRTKISNLFRQKAKKCVAVTYKGKLMKIDREKFGTYRDLIQREKTLEKMLENKENQSLSIVQNRGELTTNQPLVTIGLGTFISLKFVNFIKKFKNFSMFSKGKKKLFSTNRFTNIKNKKHYSFKDLFKKKESININNKDNFRRRVAAGVCALTIVISGFMLSKCNKNSSSNINPTKESTSQSNDMQNNSIPSDTSDVNNNVTEPTDNNIKDDEIVNDNGNDKNEKPDNNDNKNDLNEDDTQKDDVQNENGTSYEFSFGDTVTIDNNAYIYTNSYDATYETGSLNPYYNGHHERDIQGIVYELNGNIYVIYESDINASAKQKELEGKGAKITAVLVTRNDLTYTGEYEGYYNASSVVKVKTR